MSPAVLISLAAVIGTAVLVGCGPNDPYAADGPSSSTKGRASQPAAPAETPPTVPPESGELPGRAPRELLDEPTEFPEARETPQATLALAGRVYGNWTSANATRQLRRIAALSVGQAHAELRQAATQSTVDLQQHGARSSATVEAIDVRGQGLRRRALIVTRERIEAADLPGEGWRYRLTVAAVERRADGWVISRWVPQP
jgi:hypothetical protein